MGLLKIENDDSTLFKIKLQNLSFYFWYNIKSLRQKVVLLSH